MPNEDSGDKKDADINKLPGRQLLVPAVIELREEQEIFVIQKEPSTVYEDLGHRTRRFRITVDNCLVTVAPSSYGVELQATKQSHCISKYNNSMGRGTDLIDKKVGTYRFRIHSKKWS